MVIFLKKTYVHKKPFCLIFSLGEKNVCQSNSQLIGNNLILRSRLLSIALHKKWSFPLRISSVNKTKSAVSCGFGPIYWRNPYWKTSFFVQCTRHLFITKLFLMKLKYNFLKLAKMDLSLFLFWGSNICIIHLHVIEACLIVTIANFVFAIRKTLKILRKIFLIPSLYIFLEKKISFSTNIRNFSFKSLLFSIWSQIPF